MISPQLDHQRRVSERAYQIWLDEGRPANRGVEHWNRAEEMIAAEDEALRRSEAMSAAAE